MTWTNLTFAFGSILTSTKMTQLYDNITATANGDSGAPKIQTAGINDGAVTEAKYAAGSVNQAALKTTYGDILTTATFLFTTGPGGNYGFWPAISSNTGTSVACFVLPVFNDSGVVLNTVSATNQFYIGIADGWVLGVRQRYVTASPPYDLGNGDIPLFVFAIVNNSTGAIESIWTAEDPPWANNGPTDIRPDYIRDGKKYQCRKVICDSLRARLKNKKTCADALAELKELEPTEMEITQAIKQADMPLIPHPFLGNDMTGKTLVMLDPLSNAVQLMADMLSVGDSPNDLAMEGFLKLGNEHKSGLIVPPGLIGVDVEIK